MRTYDGGMPEIPHEEEGPAAFRSNVPEYVRVYFSFRRLLFDVLFDMDVILVEQGFRGIIRRAENGFRQAYGRGYRSQTLTRWLAENLGAMLRWERHEIIGQIQECAGEEQARG